MSPQFKKNHSIAPQLVLFLHISPSWVKIRLYTKNQLPRMSESGLKVPGGWGGGGGWLPTHYQVKLQLMLILSWAVTINTLFIQSNQICCENYCIFWIMSKILQFSCLIDVRNSRYNQKYWF